MGSHSTVILPLGDRMDTACHQTLGVNVKGRGERERPRA